MSSNRIHSAPDLVSFYVQNKNRLHELRAYGLLDEIQQTRTKTIRVAKLLEKDPFARELSEIGERVEKKSIDKMANRIIAELASKEQSRRLEAQIQLLKLANYVGAFIQIMNTRMEEKTDGIALSNGANTVLQSLIHKLEAKLPQNDFPGYVTFIMKAIELCFMGNGDRPLGKSKLFEMRKDMMRLFGPSQL